MAQPLQTALRRVVGTVALLNLAYFGIEFTVATRISSVSLFADSIDFLEDASVNILVAVALGWSLASRSRVGMVLALMLLVPAAATLWTAFEKLGATVPPEPLALSLTGLGALLVNASCALMLAAFRTQGGSLTRAAFLSARNDAFANIAIVLTGLLTTTVWASPWPDLAVGLAIAAINVDAAREVWETAMAEGLAAKA